MGIKYFIFNQFENLVKQLKTITLVYKYILLSVNTLYCAKKCLQLEKNIKP